MVLRQRSFANAGKKHWSVLIRCCARREYAVHELAPAPWKHPKQIAMQPCGSFLRQPSIEEAAVDEEQSSG